MALWPDALGHRKWLAGRAHVTGPSEAALGVRINLSLRDAAACAGRHAAARHAHQRLARADYCTIGSSVKAWWRAASGCARTACKTQIASTGDTHVTRATGGDTKLGVVVVVCGGAAATKHTVGAE